MTIEPDPWPGTDLELDLLTLVGRLEQVDREEQPEHFLWTDRIMGCDVARMRRKWISPEAQAWADRVNGGDK